jgi:uncharacterized protein
MPLNVLEFLAHPGRRFPVNETLVPVSGEADDLRIVGEMRLDGVAFAQLGTLYLDVEMKATIAQPCGRCAKPLERLFSLRESFTIPIPPSADSVDIRPTAVSLILSAHNPHVLCDPGCRGLCPACGADLNENPGHACAKRDRTALRLGDLLSP